MTNQVKEIQDKYGYYHSLYEAYGVMIEEVQEFFDIVKEPTFYKEQIADNQKWTVNDKKSRAISELNDIINVCRKTIQELENNQIKFI